MFRVFNIDRDWLIFQIITYTRYNAEMLEKKSDEELLDIYQRFNIEQIENSEE